MGWGLSKLQWRILELASDALEPLRGDAEEGTEHPLLKYADILTDCYGWPQVAENDQRLRRALIGKERYHAGIAAVSRACIRLEARGLVSIYSGSASSDPPYGYGILVPGFSSFGVSDYFGDPWAGSFGQCTWWAAHKRPDENFAGIGDAWTWANGARARGYTVTADPVVNATVAFDPGVEFAGGIGHVAHVEQILSNGWILISEMNFFGNNGGWGRVDYRYITPGPGVWFIH